MEGGRSDLWYSPVLFLRRIENAQSRTAMHECNGCLLKVGVEIGERLARLEHRVAALETTKVDLHKVAEDLNADAAKTEKAASDNPVPGS